jgi:hypothetical protein
VLWFASLHYEAVEYDSGRIFRSDHAFVRRLQQLCTDQGPRQSPEEDLDQRILADRLQPPPSDEVNANAVPSAPQDGPLGDSVSAANQSTPVRRTTRSMSAATKPAAAPAVNSVPQQDAARTAGARRSSSRKGGKNAPPAPGAPQPRASSESQAVRSAASSVPAAGGAPLSLSAADIAAHGELYDYISFPNVPQWISMCTIPFNAYRLASQSDNRAAQNSAVQDILMLPQRVLGRTGRGPGDGRRLNRTVRARCYTHSQQLRQRYDCQPPRDHHVQLDLAVHTDPPPPSPAPPLLAAPASSPDEESAASGDGVW